MGDRLRNGERLVHGESLRSRNGRYVLRMQEDGNLVLYAPGNVATWASNTRGARECVVEMQHDGNLVVIAAGNRAVWESGTQGKRHCVLIVQDDGNLVVYAEGNRSAWATGTDLRDMRLEITENGRPRRDGGVRFSNESDQPISMTAGALTISVPPGGEAGIEPINASRPAVVNIRATSGGHHVQVGQLEIQIGEAIPRGHHRAFTSSGDMDLVPD